MLMDYSILPSRKRIRNYETVKCNINVIAWSAFNVKLLVWLNIEDGFEYFEYAAVLALSENANHMYYILLL